MPSFKHIKPKIKNLDGYKTLAEIKRDGLRVAYNRADDAYWLDRAGVFASRHQKPARVQEHRGKTRGFEV